MELYNSSKNTVLVGLATYIRELEMKVEHINESSERYQTSFRSKTALADQDRGEIFALRRENNMLREGCQLLIMMLYAIINWGIKLSNTKKLIELKEDKLCNKILEKKGINISKTHIFSDNLLTVISAINNKEIIDGIDISEEIKKEDFRFYTEDQPLLSLEISDAFAGMARLLKEASHNFMDSGRKKRSENADSFARRMHDIINQVRSEKKISSYIDTAKALNDKGVPTYLEGEWRPSTLSDLNKRFKKLGLTPLTVMPK